MAASNNDLQIRLGVIEDRVKTGQDDNKRRLERIEQKLDNMNYVNVNEFEKFKEFALRTYATKEEIGPGIKLFWGIITTIILTLVTGVLTFIFKGGIK